MPTRSFSHKKPKLIFGWREWAALPALNVPAIKLKVDTGAKTSALHAFDLVSFIQNGQHHVRFSLHPLQRNDQLCIPCVLPVVDYRAVKSSNGIEERRYTVLTPIRIGAQIWDIEITLTNRDFMSYRMLLGRTAMGGGGG